MVGMSHHSGRVIAQVIRTLGPGRRAIIVGVVLSVVGPARAQWIVQSTPTTEVLRAVDFVDNLTGYAVGNNGIIIKTTDGGATWTDVQDLSYMTTLYGVHFPVDTQTGYVVGASTTILKTVNGGSAWTSITPPISQHLYGVYFLNDQIGFVVGGSGKIIKTTNGGTDWTDVSNLSVTSIHQHIQFTDANTGYIVGHSEKVVLKTTNGGTLWTDITDPDIVNSPEMVDFPSGATVGYIAGISGLFGTTTDGGADWVVQYPTAAHMYGVDFVDVATGYIVGNSGTVLKTTDGGTTWEQQYPPTINRLLDVCFPVDANTAYIVGDGGTVLKTTAGASSDLVLHPTGDGSVNSFSSATGCPGGNWDCVNDQTGNAGTGKWEADDDLTSYLQDLKDAVGREMFSLDNGLIPAGATVTSIDIYATVGRTGGPSPSASLSYQRVGGQDLSPIDAPAVTISAINTDQDISASFGCLGWPGSDLDDLEIGIVHVSGGKLNITQIYVIVHYETTKVNFRSIGTGGTIYSAGTASAAACSNVVTFGGVASLPTTVGSGDKLLIAGTETRYIYSRDSATQVTLQDPVTNDYSTGATYSISRAYGTLQDWETGQEGNLVADDLREVGVCYNDAAPFTSGVVISGSTTDVDHYITLTVAEGQRHNGTAGSGARIDAGGGLGVHAIQVSSPYTTIRWLEITDFNDGKAGVKVWSSANGVTVENMVIHNYKTGFPGAGVSVFAPGTAVRNCIIYDGSPFGIYVEGTPPGEVIIDNCTIYDTGLYGPVGIAGSTVGITNTIAVGSGTDVTLLGTVSFFGNNMFGLASGFDTEAYGGSNQSPPGVLEDLFISVAGADYHLEASGHSAAGTGLDLSTRFADDIDGAARIVPWDIGADDDGSNSSAVSPLPRIISWMEVQPD